MNIRPVDAKVALQRYQRRQRDKAIRGLVRPLPIAAPKPVSEASKGLGGKVDVYA